MIETPNPVDGMTDWAAGQYKRLLREKIKRESEALRLYEPQPHQEAYHRSKVSSVVMQKGNQVGGTLCGAVEVARAVTGQDPYNKYPKKNGVVALLGYGEKHIGTVFYPKLFKPGAFDVIRDLDTGKWRTFRPWPEAKGGDLERESEKTQAPPLIPNRFLDGRPAWVKRNERIFSVVRFVNGWELRAFNSAGDSGQAQGFEADLYWVDEDIEKAGWINEIFGRLVKRDGLLRWTAIPHGKNDEMMRLIEKAHEDSEKAEPTTAVIRATIFDNHYLKEKSVAKRVEDWKAQGDDIYRQRALGELNLESTLMYPRFNRRLHDVMNVDDHSSQAQKILAERMGYPPSDWTVYVAIDPGWTTTAIMFLTVPPPEMGGEIFIFDECYMHDATSVTFGEAMQLKCRDRVIEAFIMDMHGGRLRSISSGEIPVDKYTDALRERGIKSEQLGFHFRQGEESHKRREEVMRNMLAIRRDGKPQLMVVTGTCPNFCKEMENFRKKTVKYMGKDMPIDEGNRRVMTHAVEAVEMSVALDLGYVKPRPKAQRDETVDWVKEWGDQNRRNQKIAEAFFGGKSYISLGPQGGSR